MTGRPDTLAWPQTDRQYYKQRVKRKLDEAWLEVAR